jgi:hypothetical protein
MTADLSRKHAVTAREAAALAVLVGIGVAVVAHGARSEPVSGNEPHEWCSGTSDVLRGICAAYVLGAAEGGYFATEPEPFCLDRATRGQLVDAVKTYLNRHSDVRQVVPAASFVWGALREAFPCEESR